MKYRFIKKFTRELHKTDKAMLITHVDGKYYLTHHGINLKDAGEMLLASAYAVKQASIVDQALEIVEAKK